jgi:hypothetical protein
VLSQQVLSFSYYLFFPHELTNLLFFWTDLYTIEFQKRGLPHCHTLLWVMPPYKITHPHQVDTYISAELPDKLVEPELYKIVTESMIHGPCGPARQNSPCMRDGICRKKFPKPYEMETRFDSEGRVYYKRSRTADVVLKNDVALDSAYVVPYNPMLCKVFNAHINVEYRGWSMLIKYLFKYISKGPDRVKFKVTGTNNRPILRRTHSQSV